MPGQPSGLEGPLGLCPTVPRELYWCQKPNTGQAYAVCCIISCLSNALGFLLWKLLQGPRNINTMWLHSGLYSPAFSHGPVPGHSSVSRRQVRARVSREWQSRHPVVVGHEEDASCATDEEREHGQEADTIQDSAHQKPLFIPLRNKG